MSSRARIQSKINQPRSTQNYKPEIQHYSDNNLPIMIFSQKSIKNSINNNEDIININNNDNNNNNNNFFDETLLTY